MLLSEASPSLISVYLRLFWYSACKACGARLPAISRAVFWSAGDRLLKLPWHFWASAANDCAGNLATGTATALLPLGWLHPPAASIPKRAVALTMAGNMFFMVLEFLVMVKCNYRCSRLVSAIQSIGSLGSFSTGRTSIQIPFRPACLGKHIVRRPRNLLLKRHHRVRRFQGCRQQTSRDHRLLQSLRGPLQSG